MDRREFISVLIAMASVAGVPATGQARPATVTAFARRLGGLLADRDPAAVPQAAALAGQLLEIGAERAATTLDRLRQSDFAAGRTVIVDGWLLSRSEALLCVASLQPGAADWPFSA